MVRFNLIGPRSSHRMPRKAANDDDQSDLKTPTTVRFREERTFYACAGKGKYWTRLCRLWSRAEPVADAETHRDARII